SRRTSATKFRKKQHRKETQGHVLARITRRRQIHVWTQDSLRSYFGDSPAVTYKIPSYGRGNSMKHNALRDLYIDELKDIYDAENRLVKALPKLAKAATSDDLRAGFEAHLEQTRGHVERLQEIFQGLGEKPTGKKCNGMMGLVKEGEEIMDEDFEGEVMDAALI